MKRLSVVGIGIVAGLLVSEFVYGQQDTNQQPTGRAAVKRTHAEPVRLDAGYQTAITGWIIQPGDTIQLGRGSLPDKSFAFINERTVSSPSKSADRSHLAATYAGRRVVLIKLESSGTRATGFSVYGVVDGGEQPPYYADLDNAIQGGELLPPVKFRPSAQAAPVVPVSVAKELIKLKSLLDAGTITQQEFDAQKKKLLN